MYVKTAVLTVWFGRSYVLLVFAATSWWQAIPLALSLACAMAGIGFGIQHDAKDAVKADPDLDGKVIFYG